MGRVSMDGFNPLSSGAEGATFFGTGDPRQVNTLSFNPLSSGAEGATWRLFNRCY